MKRGVSLLLLAGLLGGSAVATAQPPAGTGHAAEAHDMALVGGM